MHLSSNFSNLKIVRQLEKCALTVCFWDIVILGQPLFCEIIILKDFKNWDILKQKIGKKEIILDFIFLDFMYWVISIFLSKTLGLRSLKCNYFPTSFTLKLLSSFRNM